MKPPTFHEQSLSDIKTLIQEQWLEVMFRSELMPLALSIFNIDNPDDVQPYLSFNHHMQIAQAIWKMQPVKFYSQIKVPVLAVLATMNSEYTKVLENYSTLLAQKAQAKIVIMNDTGHDIPWHRPDELVEILLDYLDIN